MVEIAAMLATQQALPFTLSRFIAEVFSARNADFRALEPESL
jgi:hypothetical protein